MNDQVDKIKNSHTLFQQKMDILKNSKKSLFSLFRKKLEDKKIEEIKNNLTKNI